MSTYPKVESSFLVQINYRSPGNMKTDICISWGQFRVCYLWEQPSLWFLVSFVPACGWKLCNVVFVCGRVGVACTWLQMGKKHGFLHSENHGFEREFRSSYVLQCWKK